MSQLPPRHRMLPGTVEPQPVPSRPADYADSGETMSFRQALIIVRRRALLILLMTAIGAGIGLYLAWDMPASYTASAMLRMAGERQTLTGDNEEAPGLIRTADPLMSIIQLFRSRTVAADVVDSSACSSTARPRSSRSAISSTSRWTRAPPATPWCSPSATRT